MRDGSIRIALGVLLATTALATPAFGQTYQPMERQAPDENGVDVISGKVTIPLKTVGIGSGDSSLTYSKGFAAGQPWDTFDVKIFSSGAGQPTLVTIFGDQRRFTGSAPSWTNADGDGGTLTSDASSYTYTARDGTVFLFLNSLGDTSGSVKARVSTITRANGEVWTYHYKTLSGVKRVQSVTTNHGYQLKATYASNAAGSDFTKLTGVRAINNAVDYCSPTADSCSGFTQAWPSISFTASTSGGTTTEEIADPEFNISRILYNILEGPTSYTPASSSSPSLTINYYADGRVQNLTKGGGTWGYSYSDNGSQRTTIVTQPLGGSKTYVSDLALKRILSFTDELNRTISLQYDGFGRQTRVIGHEGNYTHLTYDGRGNVTEEREVSKTPGTPPDIVSQAAYPLTCTNPKTCNQPDTTTDPKGNITDYDYDPGHGGVTSVTLPPPTPTAVQPQLRFGYSPLFAWYKNSAGTIVQGPGPITKLSSASQCQTLASCAGSPDEARTILVRGTTGVANNLLVTSTLSGAGDGSLTATSSFTYNAIGKPSSADGPLPGKVDRIDYIYDEDMGRLTDIIHDPDGSGPINPLTTTYLYDADGRVSTVRTSGRGTTAAAVQDIGLTYDPLGRVTRRRISSGLFQSQTHAVTHYTYDQKGRLQCVNVRMNPANFVSLGPSCTLSTAGSFGPDRITRLEYSLADEVTKQTAAYLTTDAADEMTLTYTGNGMLETLKDAENNLTTYEYDGFDRLRKTRFPVATQGANSSSTTDFEELAYDPNGNVASRIPRGGSAANPFNYVYDALDRLAAKGPPNPEPTTLYSYDNLGRLLSAAKTTGESVSFTYDALSRNLTQVGPQGTVTSEWDIGGRRSRLIYPGAGLFLDYDYNGINSLWRIRENGALSGPGVLASFEYDGFDRRSLLLRGNGRRTLYEYDRASRLSALVNTNFGSASDVRFEYSYNPASRIATRWVSNDSYAWTGHFNENRTGTANGLNQLTQVGAKSLSHDARGNVTSFGAKSFTYTSENMMNYGPNGTMLSYDPAMRLREVTSGSSTRLAYDGLDRILEADGANAVQRRYVHGPGTDEPLVWYEGSGTSDRRFLEADERGSVILVADTAGATLATNRYDEYGQPQATNLGMFGYTGQAWLPTIGEWYYKARNYDPELGRFLQTDPIGYEGGINLYAYVVNDPINWLDPLGLGPAVCVSGVRPDGGCDVGLVLGPASSRPGSGRGGYSRHNLTDLAKKPGLSSACQLAVKESGTIRVDSVDIKLIALAGVSYQTGTFENLKTGTKGRFTTWGAGLGADVGYSASETYYTSLGSFIGYSETLASGAGIKGIGTISVSQVRNVNNQVIGLGGSYAPPTKVGLGRVGTSVVAGDTHIYDCSTETK